ncbi:sulfite exporter TauE/SafE family protein [Fructobacillus sp. M2-14]|uniref:Probable membrane transporter protein n=1 Tax=Fructobacillus broussonetiae TaxID=2713173 RepID=A0ABS5R0E3_9LACO|nr:sulfite exporter TauE/SafE family protein [Fructobacillus broussonetiae]MBS9338904.1 sulfite exporter TauE/SafE family protein [Fructobacillus broussonetiae]
MDIIFYGFLIGCFVTLIGGGGATFYLGVLTATMGMSTKMAVPTSLFIAVFALFSGFMTQLKLKNIELKVGNRMILAALPGIVIGTYIGQFIPTRVYQLMVGTLFIVMGSIVLVKKIRGKKTTDNADDKSQNTAMGFGFLSGLMVGFGGLSGGSATTAGLSIIGIPSIRVAGTTTYVLWALAVVGLGSHLVAGSPISYTAGLYLMIGGIIGSILTPLVMGRLNTEKFNKFLGILMGVVIIYFGLNMIF